MDWALWSEVQCGKRGISGVLIRGNAASLFLQSFLLFIPMEVVICILSTILPTYTSYSTLNLSKCYCILFYFFIFYFFVFSRATPEAYGDSHVRGLIGAVAAGLRQNHSNLGSKPSETYTTAHGNAGSLTHWARPGIEPSTSWFLVRWVNHCTRWELQLLYFFIL